MEPERRRRRTGLKAAPAQAVVFMEQGIARGNGARGWQLKAGAGRIRFGAGQLRAGAGRIRVGAGRIRLGQVGSEVGHVGSELGAGSEVGRASSGLGRAGLGLGMVGERSGQAGRGWARVMTPEASRLGDQLVGGRKGARVRKFGRVWGGILECEGSSCYDLGLVFSGS